MHLDLTYSKNNNYRVQNKDYKYDYEIFTKTFFPSKKFNGLDCDNEEYEYNDINKIILGFCNDKSLSEYPENLKILKIYDSTVETIKNLPVTLEELLLDNCINLENLDLSNNINLKKIIIQNSNISKIIINNIKLEALNYVKIINTHINKEEFTKFINKDSITFFMIKNDNIIPLELSYKPKKINI